MGVHAEEAHEGVELAHAVLQGRAGQAPVCLYVYLFVYGVGCGYHVCIIMCAYMYVGVGVAAGRTTKNAPLVERSEREDGLGRAGGAGLDVVRLFLGV